MPSNDDIPWQKLQITLARVHTPFRLVQLLTKLTLCACIGCVKLMILCNCNVPTLGICERHSVVPHLFEHAVCCFLYSVQSAINYAVVPLLQEVLIHWLRCDYAVVQF